MCWCDAGPSLMPGGTPEAYQHIEPIVQAVAAQVQLLFCAFHWQTEHCHPSSQGAVYVVIS